MISILMIGAFACSGNTDKGAEGKVTDRAVPVDVVVAGQGEAAGTILLSGTLDPINQTNVATKVSGICRNVYVEVGDRVKKGDRLASLDQKDYVLSVKQAEAAFETAKLAAEVAEADFKRLQSLKNEQSLSQSDFEKAELGYRSAVNQFRQADVGLEFARSRLSDSTVRAPYDGQIVARLVSPGTYVDPMTNPILFVITDNSKLRALLKLPETRAGLVKAGDPVTIKVASANREFNATIDVVTDSVDPMTHTRTAVAWIENTNDPIAGGLFFDAHILPEALKGKIILPSTSVRDEGGKYYIFPIKNGVAQRLEVAGRYLPDRADFILDSALEPGTNIVAESSMVRDGQAVAPRTAK